MKKKQPPGKSPRAASKAQLPLRPSGAPPTATEVESGEPASPRQHLKLPEVLAELEAAAKALEVRLTYEAIGGELGAGGLCKVKGHWRVIIDKRTTPSERVSVLAQALSRFDFPRLRLSAQIHELLVRVAPAPETAGTGAAPVPTETPDATAAPITAETPGVAEAAITAKTRGTTAAGTLEPAADSAAADTLEPAADSAAADTLEPAADSAAAGTAASPPP